MAVRRRLRYLIPGPVLIGFDELFDRSFGDPKTPKTSNGGYPKITPSRMGYALLPFICIYCTAIRGEAVDAKRRERFLDKERGFSWCPACRGRYVLDTEGQSLEDDLPAGSTFAPAKVDYGSGEITVIGKQANDGLDALGVL